MERFVGILSKKKGLWSRTRMFLLTEGPRLFYVDPKEKVLKVKGGFIHMYIFAKYYGEGVGGITNRENK